MKLWLETSLNHLESMEIWLHVLKAVGLMFRILFYFPAFSNSKYLTSFLHGELIFVLFLQLSHKT